jgi:ribosomal protein S18 acetylase RimI-like enzyme
MQIKEFSIQDIEAVKKFTDQTVGDGYYTLDELIENQKKSVLPDGRICSFVLTDETGMVMGLRLSFPPGQWQHGKGQGLKPNLWPTALHKTSYFQSLFISPQVQGQGWGPRLSQRSLEIFRQIGAEGVVAHSWKESPHNSSMKYLESVGFKTIFEHPNYWIDVDYICPRDGKPCRCTAVEMHLDLREA